MIKYLIKENDFLAINALDGFIRHQVTNAYWKFQDGKQFLVLENGFVDDWNLEELRQRVKILNQIIKNQGSVVLAYDDEKIVGFSALPNKRIGNLKNQVELKFCHVSKPYRGQGIGNMLFKISLAIAHKSGAQKLYISSHPSKETQMFYAKMGCVFASEIIDDIAKNEPYDLQLVCECDDTKLNHLEFFESV
jgi:N-acetylglutamate synthase-like GNAT family acetyltransferase